MSVRSFPAPGWRHEDVAAGGDRPDAQRIGVEDLDAPALLATVTELKLLPKSASVTAPVPAVIAVAPDHLAAPLCVTLPLLLARVIDAAFTAAGAIPVTLSAPSASVSPSAPPNASAPVPVLTVRLRAAPCELTVPPKVAVPPAGCAGPSRPP